MKIVFIGAVEFSAHALRELIAIQADVVGVCTLKESAGNADHHDLTPIAEQAGIPVRLTPDINGSDAIAWISELEPDIIFCFGWSRLIRHPLLSLAPMGVLGYHPAALPANRGRHPLIWALALGLKQTASSFFFMDEGADSGDLLSQVSLTIEDSDDAVSLYERIIEVATAQIRAFLPDLESGRFQRRPQNHEKANSWRRRGIQDGQIDWRMTAESIHNLVRALTRPYPGAHFLHQGKQIKVWKTEIEDDVPINLEPGKVLAVNEEGLLVKAGSGAIRLRDYDRILVFAPGSYL